LSFTVFYQIPFYPYAINIILDDDPDINDQELDPQQQVHLRLNIFFVAQSTFSLSLLL
jgi:hypothetical protein